MISFGWGFLVWLVELDYVLVGVVFFYDENLVLVDSKFGVYVCGFRCVFVCEVFEKVF